MNIREIVLDTETTGLSPEKGDRIVDIGCVELINYAPTGNNFHVYINPERAMGEEALKISGITDEFLRDKPKFSEIADGFLNFIGDSKLVIHNAKFDINFLNSELERIGKPLLLLENAIDTLDIARKKYPGAPASLDALCKRYEVDTSIRTVHGALVDCILLAEVYVNLLGGKQSGLSFEEDDKRRGENSSAVEKKRHEERFFPPSGEELKIHAEFLESSVKSPIWNDAEA